MLSIFLQHHISKASILFLSNFFKVHPSSPYWNTAHTIDFMTLTFVAVFIVSTVLKTLIRMLNMSTLCYSNWSQSFPKLSDCPLNEICQRKHVYLWQHEWRHKEWNDIAKNINSLSSRMKPLLSNNLCKLCSQTSWCSTFFAPLCMNTYFFAVGPVDKPSGTLWVA